MHLRVDYDKCTKSGECYYNHPDLFKPGEDGFPAVLQPDVPAELEWEARGAAEVCPVQAIIVSSGGSTTEKA